MAGLAPAGPAEPPSSAPESKPGVSMKAVIRRLPPGLTRSEFEQQIGHEWLLDGGRVNWMSYCPGKISTELSKPSRPARVYIRLVHQSYAPDLVERVTNTVFRDAGNSAGDVALIAPPCVEVAPYPRVPTARKRPDPKQGTIEKDPEYAAFVDMLANPEPRQKPAEPQLLPRPEKITTTALIEDLREKKSKYGSLREAKNARQGSGSLSAANGAGAGSTTAVKSGKGDPKKDSKKSSSSALAKSAKRKKGTASPGPGQITILSKSALSEAGGDGLPSTSASHKGRSGQRSARSGPADDRADPPKQADEPSSSAAASRRAKGKAGLDREMPTLLRRPTTPSQPQSQPPSRAGPDRGTSPEPSGGKGSLRKDPRKKGAASTKPGAGPESRSTPERSRKAGTAAPDTRGSPASQGGKSKIVAPRILKKPAGDAGCTPPREPASMRPNDLNSSSPSSPPPSSAAAADQSARADGRAGAARAGPPADQPSRHAFLKTLTPTRHIPRDALLSALSSFGPILSLDLNALNTGVAAPPTESSGGDGPPSSPPPPPPPPPSSSSRRKPNGHGYAEFGTAAALAAAVSASPLQCGAASVSVAVRKSKALDSGAKPASASAPGPAESGAERPRARPPRSAAARERGGGVSAAAVDAQSGAASVASESAGGAAAAAAPRAARRRGGRGGAAAAAAAAAGGAGGAGASLGGAAGDGLAGDGAGRKQQQQTAAAGAMDRRPRRGRGKKGPDEAGGGGGSG